MGYSQRVKLYLFEIVAFSETIFNVSSLKRATIGIRATGEIEIRAQVDVFYSDKEICFAIGFKPFQASKISNQFHMLPSIFALKKKVSVYAA